MMITFICGNRVNVMRERKDCSKVVDKIIGSYLVFEKRGMIKQPLGHKKQL